MTPRGDPMPVRRLPDRAARGKVLSGQATSSAAPTRPPGTRVTRSSAAFAASTTSASSNGSPLSASSSLQHYFGVSKRSASPQKGSSTRQSKRRRPNSGYYNESEDELQQSSSSTPPAHVNTRQDVEIVSPGSDPIRSHKQKANGVHKAMTKHSPSTKPRNKSDAYSSVETKSVPGIIPAWSELPWFILVRILQLAAGTPVTSDSAKWLLSTSRVCRAFAEPAITALYRQPPLLTPAMAHGFVELLNQPPDQMLFRYRHKVRVLSIDVKNVAAKKFKRQSLDFKTLIENLPLLAEIDLWHHSDNPANHELTTNLRWRYPPEIFAALGYEDNGRTNPPLQKLSTWTWNSRMMGDLTLNRISHIHASLSFRHLRKVTFINFQVPSLHAANPDDPEALQKDNDVVTALAKAISLLPQLRHLVLESSTAVTGSLLRLLPKSIQHLEINNCWDLTAEDFTEYILSHGYGLQHLTLYHNQFLSLGFLPALGDACPVLESLDMDLTYYSLNGIYTDTQPSYDTLLAVDQVPTWPSSLQYLSIKPLRQLDEFTTDMFFQSLVASAGHLLMLRHLEIKVMLNIPFRERCHMRDKWESKLKEVFLRPSTDPQPVHSIRQQQQQPVAEIQLVAPLQTPGRKGKARRLSPNDKSVSPPRRSSRIATLPSAGSSRHSSVGRDVRAGSIRPFYAEPDTDDDVLGGSPEPERELSELARELSVFSEQGPEAPFIQGLCEVVDIRIDNQKPMETQWTADDFLDSEPDDLTEDEWDEDADAMEDEGYAW